MTSDIETFESRSIIERYEQVLISVVVFLGFHNIDEDFGDKTTCTRRYIGRTRCVRVVIVLSYTILISYFYLSGQCSPTY